MGGGQGNRNLADFSSVTIDPSGCALYTYTDDGSVPADQTNFAFSQVNNDVAHQSSGCFAPSVSTPEAPVTVALALAGGAAVAAWTTIHRRRQRQLV
jgi:hypothetical protein